MSGYKKFILTSFVTLLVIPAVFFYGSVQVFAQIGPPSPTVVVADVPAAKWNIWQKINGVLDKVKAGITTQLVNQTLTTFMNKLAYDVASNIATGGPGKTPLFEKESFTKSIQTAKDAALGEFIGQLSQNSFEDLGFNLCDPSLGVKLTLTLSLIDAKAPPKPSANACDWSRVKKEWAKFGDNFTADLIKVQLDTKGGSKNLDDFFANGFSMEQTDLGVFAKLNEAARQKEKEAEEAKKALYDMCAGYKDVQGPITEDVKASCRDVEEFKNLAIFEAADVEKTQISDSALKKEIGVIGQIMNNAGKIFVNTFTSKLMSRWLKDGMCSLLGGGCTKTFTNPNLRNNLLAQLRGGSDVNKTNNGFVIDFQKIEPTTLEAYSIMDDFAICPEDIEFRKPDNCVVSASFVQAVSSRTTVQDAINKGLLNPNLPLIGSNDDLRNANKECYKDGLCYHNLVKLRKANVIPVGWELAALKSPADVPVTLQQAIDCFEDGNGKCSVSVDPSTGHNPYYHLIDPYWILKIPPAFCNAYVYSPVLESPDTSNRQQYCADVKTCLREDAEGNCLAGEYGYCTKTENAWRFTGDECKDGDVYSGCLTFENETLPRASYLEQSLDYCSGDDVGCKRYSQEQNKDGNWVFQTLATDDDDLFLNNNSATCPSDMAGCSEYIVMAADTGTNLVANGSFDNIDGDKSLAFATGTPDGWVLDPSGVESDGFYYDGDKVANGYPWGGGGRAGTEHLYQAVPLLPNTSYKITASAARYELGVESQARISIVQCDINNECANISLSKPIVGDGFGDCDVTAGDNNANLKFYPPADGSMMTDSCTFTTNGEEISLAKLFVVSNANNVSWFDDVKLEMISDPNETATANYSEYGTGSKININGTRFMCTAEEVGCQGYTPANGDPMIPGVISQNDLCPNECVGYATFAEEPDRFDLIEDAAATFDYYNFIPSTAKSCPATAVGCEEFTNVDAVADGGEGKEYYSYLRQCVPVSLGKDYITWEGTDSTGYQIRAWKALPSDPASLAVTAPCTNILPGSNDCNDTGLGITEATCGPDTASLLDDPSIDANCRQFFDAEGNSFYRLQDRVIFATDDCHDYRRTLNPSVVYRATTSMSTQCTATQNGCRAYYGNTANNVRNVFKDDFERTTYAPWQGASPTVLDLSSESLEKNGHSLKLDRIPGITQVPVSGIQNKKQYELSWWMKSSVSMGDTLDPVSPRPAIAVSLLVNDTSGFSRLFPLSSNTDSSLGIVAANNWQYYSITQYLNNLDPSLYDLDSAKLFFMFQPNDANETGNVFLDNVILKEVASNIYAIRDSWQTPASCDTPYKGYHLGCQTYTDTNRNTYDLKSFTSMCRVEAIGCMAVIDTHNSDYPFEQVYNSSCSDGVSTTPGTCVVASGTWHSEPSQMIVPADNIDYLVPDNRKYCSASYQGCQALGLPDRLNPSYLPTVYKINDPDQYNSSLCMNEALGCEEYISDKGAYYFKDPGIDTCTYQSNVMVAGNVITGWFKTANLKDVLPLGCLDTDGIFDADEYVLGQKAASCPSDKNLCTTFYDPTDPADPACDSAGKCKVAGVDILINNERECLELGGEYTAPTCQAYYYYNNDKIDKASCAGQVDKNNGCTLFKEANNWNADHSVLNVNYDTKKSYALNVSQAGAVSPVTCDPATDTTCKLDSNVLLKVSKDRQCSEWLACRTSTSVWDKENNRYRVVCTDVGTCNKFDSSNNITKCASWVDPPKQALTLSNYQSRSTGGIDSAIQFGDDEYTGYSVPNMLPIQTLAATVVGTTATATSQLLYNSGASCSGEGSTCSALVADEQFYGICIDGKCLVNPVVGSKVALELETRGYAQVDSPFPSSISPDSSGLDRLQAYAGANICEVDMVEPITASPNGCEQTYVKATYGSAGTARYYPTNFPSPGGVCLSGNTYANIDCVDSGGFAQNYLCDTYNNDGTSRGDGMCDKKIRAETISNLTGICLEYDAKAKVINDTGGTNYCNQWYPSEQITGTSSFYDSYREAGYYEPGGRDALFCAVPSNYITTSERVYCIAKGTSDASACLALAVVPSDSKIDAKNVGGNSSIVDYGFLKKDAYTFVPAEGSSIDYPTNTGFDNGIGLDRIEKANLTNAGYSESRFTAVDFKLSPNSSNKQLPVYSLNTINGIFVPASGKKISVFYLDEDVVSNFTENLRGRVWVGNRLDSSGADFAGTVACADMTGAFFPDGSPEDTANNCDDTANCDGSKTWHSVAETSSFDECNPLEHNYYLKAEVRTDIAYDCSASISKGLTCLDVTGSAFYNISTPAVCSPLDRLCQFKKCIEAVDAAGSTHGGLMWCSDYGKIWYERGLPRSSRDKIVVSGCLASILETDVQEYDLGQWLPYDITSYSLDSRLSIPPVPRELLVQAIGNVSGNAGSWVEDPGSLGCLESNLPLNTAASMGMQDYFICGLAYNSTCTKYPYEKDGSICTGANCYQQCQVIVQLDPEGELSKVRTDIWWRNETGSGASGRENYMNGPGVSTVPTSDVLIPWPTVSTWESYYYKTSFIRNSKVNYGGITGESVKFTHFGSALGFLGNDIVNLRVPVNASVFSPLSAVTYFATTTSATGEPTTRELKDGSNTADWQFLFLFGKVHRLVWNPAKIFYEPYTYTIPPLSTEAGLNGEVIYPPADYNLVMANKYAGLDYDPVILKVCGNNVCSSGTDSALDGLTINEVQSGNIIGKKSLFATLKFYYFAHPDHMPINNIIVDWDDGSSDTSVPGKYKNNIPDCNVDLPFPGQSSVTKQGFGGTERACREAYKTFYHDYQPDPVNHPCPVIPDIPAGSSCYQPTVTIEDHWFPYVEGLYTTSRKYTEGYVIVTPEPE